MTRICFLLLAVALLSGCGGGTAKQVDPAAQKQAELLTMEQCRGYLKVDITDPWHEGKVLHTYLLVPRDSAMPQSLPEGTVVRTPITHALVFSEVHTGLLRELGSFSAVKGVCDAHYFTDAEVLEGIKSGAIADCGNSMMPTIEKVIAMHPDAILLSPYQDASYGQIEKTDIPIIECADYLEYSPLGRAEWMKFYGALVGKKAMADSLYEAVASRYRAIAQKAAIVNKYRDISLGRVIMICDIFIISSSYFVVHDWERVLYGYVVLYVQAFCIDQVVNSRRRSVQFFIISKKYMEIGKRINTDADRGVTVVDASGFYSGQEVKMLFVLAKQRQSQTIFRLIEEIDPHAFVSQSAVIGVYGEGFDQIKYKAKKKEEDNEEELKGK